MKTQNHHGTLALIELTSAELVTINNALNEVCNGVRLENEFDTRMGCAVEEARRLLAEVNELIRSMRDSN